MKPILRLLHAKLAFHPLSPKKKHCINAHYPETWGLFKSPPFLLFSFALSSALLPPSAPLLPRLHSLFPRTLAPVPPLRACTCALPCALAHTRASADFRFLPSPFTALSQLTVYQDTRGEHLSTLSPSPFLHLPSRDSPQSATEKSHFFPTLPPYFSRHSPYLANCKISHRAGEGIFLKAFTPYALIYCALRPTGEEVKEKNENLLTRAREGNPKNTPATPCRLSPRPNIRLPHVAATFFFLSYSFPLLLHVAQSRCGEERKCMYAHFNAAQRGTRPRVFDTKHNKRPISPPRQHDFIAIHLDIYIYIYISLHII